MMVCARQPATASTFRQSAWVLAGITLIAFGVRAWRLQGDLNADEVWILSLMRGSWRDMVAGLMTDWVHPPLSYVLLRGWCAVVGANAETIRWWSALCGVASIIAVSRLGRVLGDPRAGLVAAGLLAVSSAHIFYSQLVRPWSFVILATLLVWWATAAWLTTEGRRGSWCAGLCIILLTSSNYLGWLTVGVLTVWVFARSRAPRARWTWCGWLALAGAFTSAWLLAVMPVMRTSGFTGYVDWVQKPTVASTLKDISILHGRVPLLHGTALGLVLWLLPIGISCAAVLQPAWFLVRRQPWVWMVGGTLGLLALLWGMARLGAPVWNVRYVLPLLPLYCLVAAWGVGWLAGRWPVLGYAYAGLLLAWSIAGTVTLWRLPARMPFESVAAAIEQEPVEVPVIIERTYLMNSIWYYTRNGRDRLTIVHPRPSLLKAARVVTSETLPRARRVLVVASSKPFLSEIASVLGEAYQPHEAGVFRGVGQELERRAVRLVAYEQQVPASDGGHP